MREQPPKPPAWTRAGAVYAGVLFAVAALVVLTTLHRAGGPLQHGQWLPALFFFLYGLFTISVGYRGPNQHYTSFDRVSQVASILVLGPLDAAWINGLASLVFPLHRVRLGVPLRHAIYAGLANSGIMTLIILAGGTAYGWVGGSVPLVWLDGQAVVALLVLLLLMQLLNDAAMLGLALLSGRGARGVFSRFSYALELCSGAAAVIVALVYNRLELSAFVLLLAVFAIGMLALRQFALMRLRLEGIVEERTQRLREKTLELEWQASHDNLTGLFNRRHADNRLTQQLQAASAAALPLVVALADIDGFKQVNDQYSHAAGDEVLRRVAATLRRQCRPTDLVARYGGEEFLFGFPQTSRSEAVALCEQMRAAVAAMDWSAIGLHRNVTLSIGMACRGGADSLESLLRVADERLYAAKHAGRNRVVS